MDNYKRENIELKNKISNLQETLSKALDALQFQSSIRPGVLWKTSQGGYNSSKRFLRKKKQRMEWRKVDRVKIDHDEGYFEGYGSRYVHEMMLRDQVRTCTYRDFFNKNKELIKDKVVLDVGCGTSILCLFAAKAGAKKVIGIDRADIVDKAQEIVRANKFEHVITLIKNKVEEQVTLPEGIEKIDIIVSEWMGYFLLYESMLPSVIYARDKWLAPGGGVYPNKASIFLAGFEANDYRANYDDCWKDFYGFDMSCLIKEIDRTQHMGSHLQTVDSKNLITNIATLITFDILTVQESQLNFDSKFTIAVLYDHTLDGFTTWFDTIFDLNCSHPVTLSTSPHTPETHWKQSIFYLPKSVAVKAGNIIEGTIKAERCQHYNREYDVQLNYRIVSKDLEKAVELTTVEFGIGDDARIRGKGLYTVQDNKIS